MTLPTTFRNWLFLALSAVLAVATASLGLETLTTNWMGAVLIVLGLAYFLGGALYLVVMLGDTAAIEERGDRSLWLLGPGFLVVFLAPPLEYLYGPAILPQAPAAQAAGLALVVAGVLLRVWVRVALGRLYSGHMRVRPDHRLIRSGPYRFVRHPGYAAFILLALGVCVGYSSLVGLLAIPLVLLPGLAYRVRIEEQQLVAQFGDEYRTYARRTRRLVPFVW